jgi:hypothetical protein
MNVGKYLSGEDRHVGTARIATVKTHTEQPEALRLAEAHEFLANQAKQDEEKTIIVRLLKDSADELRRLHQVNQKLIELAEALNATLAEVCSANPNLEISCEHDERIKSAAAKLKEQS